MCWGSDFFSFAGGGPLQIVSKQKLCRFFPNRNFKYFLNVFPKRQHQLTNKTRRNKNLRTNFSIECICEFPKLVVVLCSSGNNVEVVFVLFREILVIFFCLLVFGGTLLQLLCLLKCFPKILNGFAMCIVLFSGNRVFFLCLLIFGEFCWSLLCASNSGDKSWSLEVFVLFSGNLGVVGVSLFVVSVVRALQGYVDLDLVRRNSNETTSQLTLEQCWSGFCSFFGKSWCCHLGGFQKLGCWFKFSRTCYGSFVVSFMCSGERNSNETTSQLTFEPDLSAPSPPFGAGK